MSATTRTARTVEAGAMPSSMTTPAQLERLGEHLRKLRLLKSGERLEALLQHAATQELPYAEFLEQVLGEEVAAKTSKNIAMRTAMARLPFVKPLETFEFDYQPSIDRKQVQALASCHFIEHGDNVIVLGPPGVGKTHLAVSLGLKAIGHGYRVLFTTAANLISALTRAHAEGRLDEKLKVYATPRLLIIDEIGYLPIDRLYIKLGMRVRATIRQLGYPTKNSLKAWHREYEQRRDLAPGYVRKPRYSQAQKVAAVEHFVEHGCSVSATIKALGYPGRGSLPLWVQELRPELGRRVVGKCPVQASLAVKRGAVIALCTRHGSALEVAQEVGVCRPTLYNWKKQLLGAEASASMKRSKESPPGPERA